MLSLREINRFVEQRLKGHFPETTFHVDASGSVGNEILVRVEVDVDRPDYHRIADDAAMMASQLYDVDATSIVYQRCRVSERGNFAIDFTGAGDALLITFVPRDFTAAVYVPSFLAEAQDHWKNPTKIWELIFPEVYQRKADKLGFGDEFRQPKHREELRALLEEFRPTIENLLASQELARVSSP